MNKKLISILITGCMILGISACSKEQETIVSDSEINVSVVEATTGSVDSTVSYTGDIKASTSASVSPKVSGTVKSIGADVGDYVKAGAVLMKIDDETYRLAYNQANASLSSAQAAYSNAQASYESAVAGQSSAVAGEASAVAGENSALAAYNNAMAGYNNALAAYNNVKDGSNEQNKVSLDQAVATAQIAYDNAVDNYNRQKSLFDIGAISQVALDSAKTSMDNAKLALDAATTKASLNTTVIAPQSEASAKATVDQAQAAVDQAKSAMDQAKAGVTKAKAAVSQANALVKQTKAGVDQAQAAISQAKAALDIAASNVANCTVKAPISGYISAKNIQIGQTASQGIEAFSIKNTNSFEVEINVTESVISSITVGSQAKIDVKAAELENIQGTVIVAGETKNETTDMFVVKVSIPNDDNKLKAGMLADVTLTTDSADGVLVIPADGIMQSGEETYVYVAEGSTAVKKIITVGISDKNNVQVLSGLSQGDLVICEGKEFLSETNNLINITAE